MNSKNKLLWFSKRWNKLEKNPEVILRTTNRMRVFNFHEIIKENHNVESVIYGLQNKPININNYNIFIFQKTIPSIKLALFLSSQPSRLVIFDICDPFSKNFIKNRAHYLCDLIVTSNEELSKYTKDQGAKVRVKTILDSHEVINSLQKKHINKEKINVSWYGVGVNYFSFIKRFKNIFDNRFIEFSWASGENKKWINEWGFTKGINMELDWRTAPKEKESWQKFLLKSDVGIVPVYDAIKSPHKILNYMALGIPVICSPTDSHKRIIKHGINGFFASTDEEWNQYLNLLHNYKLRKKIGRAAIDTARENYSVETTANRYLDLIIENISNKKKAKLPINKRIINNLLKHYNFNNKISKNRIYKNKHL